MANKTKKKLKGIVVSDKMQNTIVVTVHTYLRHEKYKKRYRVTRRYLAHNPENQAKIGDEVIIEECRPMSRLKRWLVVSVTPTEKVD